MDELNVSLVLDTMDFQDGVKKALDTYNELIVRIGKSKIKPELRKEEFFKVFDEIRNTAVREFERIQKSLESIDFDIEFNDKNISNLWNQISDINAKIEKRKAELGMKVDVSDLEKQKEAIFSKMEKLEIKTEIKESEKQKLLDEANKILQDLSQDPLEYDFDSASLVKYNTQIDNLRDGLTRTGKEIDKVKKKEKEAKKESLDLGKSLAGLHIGRRVMSQIRNSIASAINPLNNFRKLWNGIINDKDSDFGYTFKNIKNNLLDAFQPAIEWLAQQLINIIGYANVFLKVWSGGKIDLFKKSARTMKEMEKSAHRMTASFDELNEIGSDEKQPEDFSIMGPMLDPEVVSKLENMATSIQDFFQPIIDAFSSGDIGAGFMALLDGIGQFFAENWEQLILFAAVIGGIMLALQLLSPVAISISTTLAAIALPIAAIAAVLFGMAELIKQTSAAGMELNDVAAFLGELIIGIIALVATLTVAAIALANPMALGAVAALALSIIGILATMALTIPVILKAVGEFINTIAPPLIKIFQTIFTGITNIINALGKTLPPIIKSVGSIFKTIFDGISKVVTSVGSVIIAIMREAGNLIDKVLTSIITFIHNLIGEIENFVDTAIRCVTKLINFLISAIEYFVNLAIGAFNKIIEAVNSVAEWVGITIPRVPKFSMPKFVPKYDQGANYIPNDQLAVVHQGEAIIPAKFNKDEFFSRGNEETNNLLLDLIEAVNNIEINPYTTVKDVGSASLSYIQDKTRQLGRSVI